MTYSPFFTKGTTRDSQWLITCDHAANTVPPDIGDLGLPMAEMDRHIAYDIGAAGVARALGEALNAPVVGANFSRLVIDPNRGNDDPTLVMKLYDGTIIPGNRHADQAEIDRRIAAYYAPYHDAVAQLAAQRTDVAIVSVHSFTPQLQGRPPRPWHLGILSETDRRLADLVLAELATHTDICVGDNEPYPGYFPNDALYRHALGPRRLNILLELRQDLIADTAGQIAWANRLAPILQNALPRAMETPCPT